MIRNCTFQGQNDSGTALEIFDSNTTITNSLFLSNVAGRCSNLGTYLQPMYVLTGGAIFVNCPVVSCNINVIESVFIDNSAEMGGAIFSLTGNNIVIVQSTFVGNWVAVSNESVKNFHCPSSSTTPQIRHGLHSYLRHNTAEIWLINTTDLELDGRFTSGGAMAMFETSMIIHSSVFTSNMNLDGGAGVFFVTNISNLEIHSSTFHDNHALNRFGGVMSVNDRSHVIVNNCTVTNSRSQQGGVMDVMQSNITIIGSEFSNNSVTIVGGVITADLNSHVTLISSNFSNNTASSGGAIYALNTNVTISGGTFTNNTAGAEGGGIVVSQGQLLLDENAVFINNTAISGGALYMEETSVNVHNDVTI